MENDPAQWAIDGGLPLRNTPFAPRPAFSHEEIAAAQRVLESGRINYWTGDEGRHFEREFAAFADCEYAVAIANGTVALELGLYALGIGPGDEVIIPSRTFIASASCVLMRGSIPVIVLSPRTRANIVVHLAGWPCEMDPILELARQHHLAVVEDCAQAHGAKYQGRQSAAWVR